MKIIAAELETLVNKHLADLQSMPEQIMADKPAPDRWSKKEIVGHVIDSAESNIRRFVVGQYEDTPTITYNQDKWVSIVNYQHWDTAALIDLWFLLNRQIIEILKNTSKENGQRECKTEDIHSIEWLATDYIRHLKHHLHQILELDTIVYP